MVSKELFLAPFFSSHKYSIPSTDLLSTVLGAAITYKGDHLSAIRALKDGFDICAIGVGKTESERVQVVFRVFRNAKTCAF
jgi:hypothetical protein